MISIILASVIYLQAPNTQLQIWQKWIAPGLSYYMEYEPAGPRVVQALKINLKSADIRPICELADGVVYDNSPNKGRAPLSSIVKMDHALGGINGDFFPFKGNPLNLMVRDGEFVAMPYQPKDFPDAKRPVFAWGLHHTAFGYPRTQLNVVPDGMKSISVQGFNADALHNEVTLDSSSTGLAIAKSPNSYAVIQIQSGKWTPNAKLRGSVIATGTNLTSRAVLPGTAVLIGEDAAALSVGKLTKGSELDISIATTGFDWTKMTNAVGGNSMLVQNGKISVTASQGRLNDDFINMRHPRSAIGVDRKGQIWLVAVDGGSTVSIGATLDELAKIMQSFGCVTAMNLDGGGSVDLDVLGMTMNKPSDGRERAIANAIIVLGTPPTPDGETYKLVAPTSIVMGSQIPGLAVTRDDGSVVPQSEVFWSGNGAGWVDGGGNIHVVRPGLLRIHALLHGEQLSAQLEIKSAK